MCGSARQVDTLVSDLALKLLVTGEYTGFILKLEQNYLRSIFLFAFASSASALLSKRRAEALRHETEKPEKSAGIRAW
jgi:hypothetical protein